MVRRTRAQSITDDLAFPVRVKIAIPERGLHQLNEMLAWLKAEVGRGGYASHSAPTLGGSSAAFYFRNAEAAQRFVTAFPEAQLADGTLSPGYYSPARRVS